MNGSACKDILSLEQNESVDLEGRVSNATGGCWLGQPSELCINALCVDQRDHINVKPIKGTSSKQRWARTGRKNLTPEKSKWGNLSADFE